MSSGTRQAPRRFGLLGAGSLTLGTRVVVFAFSLLTNVILARALGPSGRGVFALALLGPSVVVLAANLGIGNALCYYLARGTFETNRVIAHTLLMSLLLGCAALLVLLAIALPFGSVLLPGVDLRLVAIGAASIPLSLFFYFSIAFFQGLQRFIDFNALYLVNACALLLLLVPLVVLEKGGVTMAVLAWSLSWIPTAAVGLYLMARCGRLSIRFDRAIFVAFFQFGMVGYLSFVTSFFNYRFDSFLVNAFGNATQVGYYAVAVSLAEVIWYIPTAAATVLAPHVAEASEGGADRATGSVGRIVLAATVFASAALAVLAPLLVNILFGARFAPSVVAIWLLLPGVVAISVGRILSGYLLGRNQQRVDLLATASGLVVTLILDVALIPRYGFAGAAVASSVAYTVTLLVNLFWVVRHSSLTVAEFLLPRWTDMRLLWSRRPWQAAG